MTQNAGRLPDTAIRAYPSRTSNILSIIPKGQIAKRPRLAMGESDRVLIAAEVIVMDEIFARLTHREAVLLYLSFVHAFPDSGEHPVAHLLAMSEESLAHVEMFLTLI